MPAILSAQRDIYLAPVAGFYEKAGLAFPNVSFVHGETMPEPSRQLLVHHSDMTPRLQRYHQAPLRLDVLAVEWEPPVLSREVILRRANDDAPVEFGAIQLHLHLLPARIADPVREGEKPLGAILGEQRFEHLSAPRAYFRTEADELMAQLLGAKPGESLYGRCNVLALPEGEVFAEIVEILPPSSGSAESP